MKWECKKCRRKIASMKKKTFCDKCLSYGNRWPRDLIRQHNRATGLFRRKFSFNQDRNI